MTTPIIDFVRRYAEKNAVRMHMPGHKGQNVLGCEPWDITEISGADELYHARGIIRESEENAAALFGSARTLYSAEGSSLCIRAMLYLALMQGRPPVLLAARNAHRVLTAAAALLDIDVRWLYSEENSLLSCPVSPAALDVRRYGVIVSRGGRRGLLLPDLDGVDTVEQQVNIARQKAGIGPEEKVTLQRFEVVRHT